MTTLPPLVEVEHLAGEFRVGGGLFSPRRVVRAVDGVSFALGTGETLGLVGESGSGKTTLGRLILRLIEPTSGTVRFDGADIYALDTGALRALRRRMQIVFQDPFGSLNPRMTVGAAVREPITVHRLARGSEADIRVAALFHEVGLDSSHLSQYPHELSGGQRQRVGIARALSVEPDFLVLDEPVSALDVSVQAQVLNLLADLRGRRGLTYLFIAHDLAVVRHLADRVAVMYLGKFMEVAPAPSLYAQPLHPYTTSLLSAVPSPDPSQQRERVVLTGEVPMAWRPPSGCVFHPRCPHPMKDVRCRSEPPPLREVQPGRWTACHYAEQPIA
ncbi:MAG: ATP-binding cassette domain-containing protein [Gemmatimonadales bacterium]|nr:ATP-binding cassette domain-containing protein [Gemmatimonadales bacterium]NIN13100.1 ATP-binding cassette domain-containing protein [Gemmatimonadales bacterium]NIN51184.1 ATP-binding cassette domain-containing protein [Gemmatimonadales bacterium]NIP08648.1 ATP-binding cassette domain-containing protein [Gemmatimonadales bacterium]NIR02336.1 ATP-binding cassette domain-containing protein [Gemmatimonadales bacterium]